MIHEGKKYDPKNWMQDRVKFLSQTIPTNIEMNKVFYGVYFDEFRLLAFFYKDPFDVSNKTALPKVIIKVKDILMLNFRVPERINGKNHQTCSSASGTRQTRCTRSASSPLSSGGRKTPSTRPLMKILIFSWSLQMRI